MLVTLVKMWSRTFRFLFALVYIKIMQCDQNVATSKEKLWVCILILIFSVFSFLRESCIPHSCSSMHAFMKTKAGISFRNVCIFLSVHLITRPCHNELPPNFQKKIVAKKCTNPLPSVIYNSSETVSMLKNAERENWKKVI